MMNIAVFGGSFNPPHRAHLNIAEEFLSLLSLDKMLIIPTYAAPHKDIRDYVSPEDRMNMCSLLFSDKRFTVSDIEIKRKGKSYTVETLEMLGKDHFDAKFYLIIGSDMLFSFDRWYRYRDILSMCTLCVMTRENEVRRDKILSYAQDVLCLSEEEIIISACEAYEMSSTVIRKKLSNGEDVSDYLTNEVSQYIKEKRLYL